jgi:hypothetical protein
MLLFFVFSRFPNNLDLLFLFLSFSFPMSRQCALISHNLRQQYSSSTTIRKQYNRYQLVLKQTVFLQDLLFLAFCKLKCYCTLEGKCFSSHSAFSESKIASNSRSYLLLQIIFWPGCGINFIQLGCLWFWLCSQQLTLGVSTHTASNNGNPEVKWIGRSSKNAVVG